MMDEQRLPALYMVWPQHRRLLRQHVRLPDTYSVRPYQASDEERVLALFATEPGWSMGGGDWRDYQDRLLPNGLFLTFHEPSTTLVATAGAVHNPRGGRYYFPYGGELANLLVHQAHRGHSLGRVLSAYVVRRFLAAGYTSIRLGVQGWRLPAIKTYLTTGFVPFLYAPDIAARWTRICDQIAWPYTPNMWPETLTTDVRL